MMQSAPVNAFLYEALEYAASVLYPQYIALKESFDVSGSVY